jgi:hypothetical protein
MRRMATRKKPDDEAAEPAPIAPRKSHPPVLMWVNDSFACVEIVDAPPPNPRDGVCRCEACHASLTADWAARFLP